MKKESIILEIRACEGGSDAKLLVSDMLDHITGSKCAFTDFNKGKIELLG